MRSSKKRSRSSQNRPRTLGNIVNRVFDSSGPEGKVRGTPQQIIEKYQMLARDAQLSNDRVAAENFLQHAEHYTRMLAEAMKEMAAEQEARQQQYQQNGQNGQHSGQQGQPRGDGQDRPERGERPERAERYERQDRGGERRQDRGGERREYQREERESEQPVAADVIDMGSGDETGLVETPESSPRRRAEAPVAPTAPVEAPEAAAEAPAAEKEDRPARRPRGPRKPKVEPKSDDGTPPKEAAE